MLDFKIEWLVSPAALGFTCARCPNVGNLSLCRITCQKDLVVKTDGTAPSTGAMSEAAANFMNDRNGTTTFMEVLFKTLVHLSSYPDVVEERCLEKKAKRGGDEEQRANKRREEETRGEKGKGKEKGNG